MSRRRKKQRDKYGIYEIPSYSIDYKRKNGRRGRKRKKSSFGVLKLFAVVTFLIVMGYAVSISIKYTMKDKGLSLYAQSDYEGALAMFEEAMKPRLPFLEKFDNDIRLYIADCYINADDFGFACQQYGLIRLWSDEKRDDVKKLEKIAYGLQLYKWKKYQEALPILLEAYEEGNSNLVLYVGSCYGQLGDLENMQLYYDVFLQNHEMNSFMYAQYAALAINNGNMEKALEYIEKGKDLEDKSNISEILFDEIIYYEKLKDYNTAFEKAEEFIEQYPDDVDGRNEYDLLYTRQTIKKR